MEQTVCGQGQRLWPLAVRGCGTSHLNLSHKVLSMRQELGPRIVHNDIQVYTIVGRQLKGFPILMHLHHISTTGSQHQY